MKRLNRRSVMAIATGALMPVDSLTADKYDQAMKSAHLGAAFIPEHEKKRLLQLAEHRNCPHCRNIISVSDAIAILQGGGWVRRVPVLLGDGRVVVLRTGDVNPQTMKVLT